MAYSYKSLLVHDIGDGVFHVQLNRIRHLNSVEGTIFDEMVDVFKKLDTDTNCRVIILSGRGRAFSTGIDIEHYKWCVSFDLEQDVARRSRKEVRLIEKLQYSSTVIEKCCKPVIAAIHGFCYGVGIAFTSACDIRYCSKDTDFSVKEVAVGLASDMGSLNRLPKIIGNQSWLREVILTARHFGSNEALDNGFVSLVCDSYDAMMAAAKETAKIIGTSSPVAVQGSKVNLNYTRDHTVDESLNYMAVWNASQVQTDDIAGALAAVIAKCPAPTFPAL